ncbi:MAG: DNA-processing protein DprA [Candidatus Erginobacter occultus]|nr:DNA-processing protein DprA [Candidatus Erginobacter occultus]
MNSLSQDAKVILLLCGYLGSGEEFKPLGLREYNQVARWLRTKELRPADLLSPDYLPALADDLKISAPRLEALMKRGVKLGFAVEKWNQSGIWVLCRSDSDYPSRYRKHLKEQAPPVLFVVGSRSLLPGGGLAIVGSRNVDQEGETFARETAARCARSGMPVISGGARGVDLAAMKGALAAGGVVIGVLADQLLRKSVDSTFRDSLADGRLLLISPYNPESRFTVGNAMGRNKLIYALADYGLVVCAAHGKGGTWAGAVEELKRDSGRPVFVRVSENAPPGNRKLQNQGAIPFPEISAGNLTAELLQQAAQSQRSEAWEEELPLFRRDSAARRKQEPVLVGETAADFSGKATADDPEEVTGSASIYESVLPVIINTLDQPMSAADLAGRLDVAKGQLDTWLKRAAGEGRIRKLTRPVRYVQ